MGLENNRGRRIYVTIKDGELQVKQSDGVVETYSALTGILTGINISEQEYQGKKYERLELTVSDGTQIYELQMRFNSGYGRGFCYCILNASLKDPITFCPSSKEVNGKKDTWLFMKQDGIWLPRYFRKDAPNGLPPMNRVRVGGKDVWDNFDQLQFWKEMIAGKIVPHLAQSGLERVRPAESDHHEVSDPDEINSPMDDLPF